MPLLTKIRSGSLSKFNTGFNADKFDLDDDALLAAPHSFELDNHAPDAFGGYGKQQDIDFVQERLAGELWPNSSDVRRKLVVLQLMNTTVMLIKMVAKLFGTAPKVYMVFRITEVICKT